jgi:drug/metabolite transporter (DMT)-like permease
MDASPAPTAAAALLGVGYGLFAAVTWGVADFLARLSASAVGTRRTLFWMQGFALWFCALFLIPESAWPVWPSTPMLGRGVLIGLLNVSAAAMLYRAFEVGTVSLVSPISSTYCAVTATLAIAAGERPSQVALVGLVVTALGVVGVSVPASSPADAPADARRGLWLAGGAALTWGVSFFLLKLVVADLGTVFPVVLSRGVAATVLLASGLAQGKSLKWPGKTIWTILGIVLFDSLAFLAYNRGVAVASTAVVSVIAALFSPVTVFLAFVVLKERLGRWQWASVGLVFVGVGLVSAG